ncbi:hypothetical protein N7519_004483 [Penicillium mononematosum]|uniref:uncharacterized protein n=1 Tax=Penicillium mononematosum TaxID=268346 RepID=UPI0025476D36|nr:uncharacterized protein N7519_004483 [Penicillium mononematosum]KAJ6189575.1 hypothetical protein N7519_004483 [Penicillium mononematosum]
MQGKKMPRGSHSQHHRRHVRRGHFQRGECKPLKVLIAVSDGNVEAEDNHTEVQNSEDEEDGDGGDWESSSQDDHDDDHDDHDDHDEVDNPDTEPDDNRPSTELAATWLDGLPRNQDSLIKAVRPETLAHLGLNCPGPGRVLDGQVLGTQVCPHSTIISYETGVLYRHQRGIVGLKFRCAPCNGQFKFSEFLRTHCLEAIAGQKVCAHKSCIHALWEGSKLCHKHFLAWKLEPPSEEMKDKLRVLFKRTTFEPWSPQTTLMTRILGIIESNGEANVPVSQIVSIDLETKMYSQEVLQIGLADLKGGKVLDCLTRYSKGVIAPSSSNLSKNAIRWQKQNEKKVKGYRTHHGALDAKSVVAKLRQNGISKDTIFLAWATWPFDLSYLRGWLRQEGFEDVLPGDENVCLLIPEFRANINGVLGRECFQGRSFPLPCLWCFRCSVDLVHTGYWEETTTHSMTLSNYP